MSKTPHIMITEQAAGEVMVLTADLDGGHLSDAVWRWSAGTDPAIPTNCWGLPNDARLRLGGTGPVVLVSDSCGLVALVDHTVGGQARLFVDLGPEADPHGVELLPRGQLVAVASKGHFVRVYAPGPGRSGRLVAAATLPGAHQVLWDAAHALLWVLGAEDLVAYRAPETEAVGQCLVPVRRHRLPTPDGHDLQPRPEDPARLWVTTVEHVYLFDIDRGSFSRGYPDSAVLDRHDVKSIGTTPDGAAVLQTRMDPGQGRYPWTTDHVDVVIGGVVTPLTLAGAEIYRARWFDERSN